MEQHRAVWGFLLESALDYGWVRVADAGAAALWIPPGRPELRPEDEARFEPMVADLLGSEAPRVLDAFDRFERAHPGDRPHYYLSLLATHPDRRGQGLGMGLLSENLARIDAEGAAAYLESTNPGQPPPLRRRRLRQVGRVRARRRRSARDPDVARPELELRQLLFELQHRREEVAVLLDPLQHVAGLEDEGRAVA